MICLHRMIMLVWTGMSLMTIVTVTSGYLVPDTTPHHYWKWHKPYSWDSDHQPKYLELAAAVHHKQQSLTPISPLLHLYPTQGSIEKPFKKENHCELRKSVFTQDPTASPQVIFRLFPLGLSNTGIILSHI